MRTAVTACALSALVLPALAQPPKPRAALPEVRAVVERLTRLGIVQSYPDGYFRSRRTASCFEVAVAFSRLARRTDRFPAHHADGTTDALLAAFSCIPYDGPRPDFSENDLGGWKDAWHGEAMLFMWRLGVPLRQDFLDKGYIRHRRTVTREELADIVARFVQRMPVKPPLHIEAANYKDVDGDGCLYGPVLIAAGSGLLRGYPDGTFRPKKMVTRGELALTLARLLEPEYAVPSPAR